MSRKRRGINAKRWFYTLRSMMRKRPQHVRSIFQGAGSEQWLNGELFAIVSSSLRPESGLYAWPEATSPGRHGSVTRQDISVFDKDDELAASLEVKLVYPWDSEGTAQGRIRRLAVQMEVTHRQDALSCGLIVGVFKSPWKGETRAANTTMAEFARWLGRQADEALRSRGIARAKKAMQVLVRDRATVNGVRPRQVGLVGQYLIFERTDPRPRVVDSPKA